MSDERRKRVEDLCNVIIRHCENYGKPAGDFLINAMLTFYDEEVAKERARCAKVCREQKAKIPPTISSIAHNVACEECAEAIEQEPT